MDLSINRRQLLSSGASLVINATLPAHAETVPMHLTAGTRIIEVNGRAARQFRLSGPDGMHGLRLAPGQHFAVELVNQAGVPTIIHWHGQTPPWTQDGFPWPQTPPIPAFGTHHYDYQPNAGTYWMHSHLGLQEQALMAAPLIVHSAAELREDRQEIVLILHDFSFRSPDELFAALQRPPVTQMGKMGQDGTPAMKMDLNDVGYDAFLANDRTLADPEVVRVERHGRVRLRVINAAAATQFWLDLGLAGTVTAVDGHAVHPVSGRIFPISMAQRLDILIDLPEAGAFPILAQVEGLRSRTGIVLATTGAHAPILAADAAAVAPPADLSLERRLSARHPLAPRRPDIVHRIVLDGGMAPYRWSMNGEYWPKVKPFIIRTGQRVVIEMVNPSMMTHPMHLHGHDFQVISINGVSYAGARRDTVMVPAKGRMVIAFDANNPGRWPFHCHNLYHMAAGMMTEFRYPGIV